MFQDFKCQERTVFTDIFYLGEIFEAMSRSFSCFSYWKEKMDIEMFRSNSHFSKFAYTAFFLLLKMHMDFHNSSIEIEMIIL